MSKTLWSWVAALALMSVAASAQNAPTAQSVLQAVAQNMGTASLRCVTYTANSGYVGIVGQAHNIRDDWPRVEIANYSRTINFEAKSSLEDRTIRQGNHPRVGGGGIPINGEQRQIAAVVDKTAWNVNPMDNSTNPQPAQADVRAIDILMNPHGFVKAAMAPGANPVLLTRWENGAVGTLAGHRYRKLNIISIQVIGKYRVNATINDENLPERIQTRVPNPVRGDLNYEIEYSNWTDGRRDQISRQLPPAHRLGQRDPAAQLQRRTQLARLQRDGRQPERLRPGAHRAAERERDRAGADRQATDARAGHDISDRRHASQRGGRVPRLHRARRSAAERGPHGRGVQSRARDVPEQADQIRRELAQPLRSSGRNPRRLP